VRPTAANRYKEPKNETNKKKNSHYLLVKLIDRGENITTIKK